MNLLIRCLPCLALIAVLTAPAVEARDDRLKFPVQSVLDSADGKAKVNPDVKLVFGAAGPKAKQQFGSFTANKKTNGLNKSDQVACDWAFLSAVISLQERALKEGGDAVVNIRSVYKKDEVKSATQYECGAGNIMAGVALRGDVVRLK